ncbi:uncharacterized protein [Phaseolus vulgaris]|uniref:uncharacterized protein n=1 Tax=Phaseolus vulgaris TaxID=3885 RepID=UPI0035CA6EE4
MAQMMKIMRALQEYVEASRVEQAKMHEYLVASQARNEELSKVTEELRQALHGLDDLVKSGFLNDYLLDKRTGQASSSQPASGEGQQHEVPTHGEIHTIDGGFSGSGCTASQRKKYARSVMAVDVFEDHSPDVDITFTKEDFRDVVPHDNDPIVVSLITAGRKVHRVLMDQGSSADVMFWPTFTKLQIPLDQLRPYGGCLYGFAGDQVEVRGYIELRTTFTDEAASRTEKIKYLVVNAPSAYNILLGRPTLNRIGAVPSTRHMKVKLPSMEGGGDHHKIWPKRRQRSATKIASRIRGQ